MVTLRPWVHRCAALLSALAVAACAADEALHAGVNTALAVGAAAVNREATGDCWASCSYGTRCDRVSGMCVDDNETKRTPAEAAAEAALLTPAPVPALGPHQDLVGSLTCEATGGACNDEGATCTIAHDRCVGQCRCLGLSWQCLESCH